MIKLGVELYVALCAFSTIAFFALALAGKRKGIFDDLESIKEFDQLVGNRDYAFDSEIDNVTEDGGGRATSSHVSI
jgi:hypothetical protein